MTQKDTYTPVFIAALYTIAKTWEQPKCSSTEEWIQKMWYIYTVEYYSAIKMNEMSAFLATWMNLEIIMLSESVSHIMRHQHHMKGHNELLCRTDADSQTLKNLWFPKETVQGWGDVLGLWDGNPTIFDCDDHFTTINVINSLSNKKEERK